MASRAGPGAVRAVLFDLDGVIVDSREHHMGAWHDWAREFDVAHAPDYFLRMFGRRNDAIIGGLLPDLAPDTLARLAARKEYLFRARAAGSIVPLPGVHDLLDALEAGRVPAAVVTSTPRENLDLILAELGIAEHFAALVAEEDTVRGKPDPEGFLAAATRLGVGPAGCIVVEDAPAGLRAAKAAGMRAVGLTTTHAASELSEADVIARDLADAAVRAVVFGG